MSKMEWIESAGGPLVVVPSSASANWKGIAADDYKEACDVEEYLGLLDRGWGRALVLGDEPLRTAVVQRHEGPVIVRWMYAPDEDQILDAALKVDLDGLQPVETLNVRMRDEPYAIFDSGADGASATKIIFAPPPGTRMIQTYVVKDTTKEIGIVMHRFAADCCEASTR